MGALGAGRAVLVDDLEGDEGEILVVGSEHRAVGRKAQGIGGTVFL